MREHRMTDTKSETESILDIIRGVDNRSIMLPEFQRDFRWEIEQTFDLFDSLIRDIFVGTLIYGKPSFGMTLREIDKRPRRGQGSRARVPLISLGTEEIKRQTQTRHLRLVLDGQQRITSLCRAITGQGNDQVYLVLKPFPSFEAARNLSLEEMLHSIRGDADPDRISVLLSTAYRAETESLEDEELNDIFDATPYAKRKYIDKTAGGYRDDQRLYRRAISRVRDLLKQEKLIAYYLLDMSVEKFCLFFERSNSRGVQLNFTDILAAKLYHGFNLRGEIEAFEDRHKLPLNRDLVIRAVAYIRGRDSAGAISIDRKTILEALDAGDFNQHWNEVCKIYVDCIQYLLNQRCIVSRQWLPLANLLLPLMMFRRHIRGFDQMNEDQRRLIEYWYWAAIFANRYSTASNEAIINDSRILEQAARGETFTPAELRAFFARLRPVVTVADDLNSYTRRTSGIFRGVLNLLHRHASGLLDWNNTQVLGSETQLEVHHIFPRAYLARTDIDFDVNRDEADELVNSVVNLTLVPKLTNISIGKNSPSVYLGALRKKNPRLAESLASHLVPARLLEGGDHDGLFGEFIKERSEAIFALISRYTSPPALESLIPPPQTEK
jgi:hypothetical protein